MAQKVILDVDTGADDAAAILLAGHHPALELVAVAAVHGNAPLSTTLENTLRTMSAGDLEHVPVYSGASLPLVHPMISSSPTQEAILPLAETSLKPQRQHAVQFLLDYYMSAAGPETIYLPVGPHTNLALALRIEPRLAQRIPRIVTMGGAYAQGNYTPSAEFNILADPEAAFVVWQAGIPITMIGLEVTDQAPVTREDTQRVRSLGTPWAQAAALVMEHEMGLAQFNGQASAHIYDACAVAAVIDPGLVPTRPAYVAVELNGTLTRGRTVADFALRRSQPNTDVGLGIDRDGFMQVLMEGLR